MRSTLYLWLFLGATISGVGQTAQEKVLYNFGSTPNDGINPVSALVADASGNLYGTAEFGGTEQGGTVFELFPRSDGTWNETTIYNFCSMSNCEDGFYPQAGLVLDANGNLYGTASQGGSACAASSGECGVVFELSPSQDESWTLSILHSFCSNIQKGLCLDGYEPTSQLIFDASGNLYGTTLNGGANGNAGVAFELAPGSGGWTETVLYSFCSIGSTCKDGYFPNGVTFDSSGNLYGTTQHGGRFRQGVVFKLARNSGLWQESVVLDNYINEISFAPVSFDAVGNLYATTEIGGFQLNVMHQSKRSRMFPNSVGSDSKAGVLIDPARNVLFGTTSIGGAANGGTVWEVNVARQLLPIYNFCSQPNCSDGIGSLSSLIEDASGNLYGTTAGGGAYGDGVVFEVTP